MRTHDTHQVLTNTDPSTIEARVAAATARVEAGLAAGTAQTGQEPTPVTSGPLSWTEVAYAALRGVVIAFALLYAISTVSGWFATSNPTDGTCREYSNQVVVCVPAYSPDGAEMSRMWEDGSAVYVDGYVFGGYSEV